MPSSGEIVQLPKPQSCSYDGGSYPQPPHRMPPGHPHPRLRVRWGVAGLYLALTASLVLTALQEGGASSLAAALAPLWALSIVLARRPYPRPGRGGCTES